MRAIPQHFHHITFLRASDAPLALRCLTPKRLSAALPTSFLTGAKRDQLRVKLEQARPRQIHQRRLMAKG